MFPRLLFKRDYKMNINIRLSALATDYIQNNRGKLSIANYVDTLITKLATSENINVFIDELNQLNNFDAYDVEGNNDSNKTKLSKNEHYATQDNTQEFYIEWLSKNDYCYIVTNNGTELYNPVSRKSYSYYSEQIVFQIFKRQNHITNKVTFKDEIREACINSLAVISETVFQSRQTTSIIYGQQLVLSELI